MMIGDAMTLFYPPFDPVLVFLSKLNSKLSPFFVEIKCVVVKFFEITYLYHIPLVSNPEITFEMKF